MFGAELVLIEHLLFFKREFEGDVVFGEFVGTHFGVVFEFADGAFEDVLLGVVEFEALLAEGVAAVEVARDLGGFVVDVHAQRALHGE